MPSACRWIYGTKTTGRNSKSPEMSLGDEENSPGRETIRLESTSGDLGAPGLGRPGMHERRGAQLIFTVLYWV
ncbi:hypothetical protein C8R44DRAFT_352484 [Mycena epipterygia]|nr:hypothetical protein C8R44DRAFT_352484 [Mycena epipterygia]